MTFRRVVFWAHLVAGVSAGVVILMLSVTGVLLTYERQMIGWLQAGSVDAAAADTAPMDADALARVAQGIGKGAATTLVVSHDPTAPAVVQLGRSNTTLIDPHTGAVLQDSSESAAAFFDLVTRVHRWFALDGAARETGAA